MFLERKWNHLFFWTCWIASTSTQEIGVPSVTIGNTTHNSAVINFDQVSDATSYDIEYNAQHDPNRVERITDVSSPYLIENLQSNINYHVRVRGVRDNMLGRFSSNQVARTAPNGSAILQVFTTPLFMVVFLEETVGATKWSIRYAIIGEDYEFVEIPSTENSLLNTYYVAIIRPLSPNTNYNVSARVTELNSNITFTAEQSPFGESRIVATDRISAFGQADLLTGDANNNDTLETEIRNELRDAYRTNPDVFDVINISIESNSDPLNYFYELLLNSQEEPRLAEMLDGLVLSDSNRFNNSFVVYGAARMPTRRIGFGFSNQMLFYFPSDCDLSDSDRDNQNVTLLWELFSKNSQSGPEVVGDRDMNIQSTASFTFTNTTIIRGSADAGTQLFSLLPNTIYAIRQNYFVRTCQFNDSMRLVEDRQYQAYSNSNDTIERFTILHTTGIGTINGSFSSNSVGTGTTITFPANLISRPVRFEFMLDEESAVLSEEQLDASSSYSVFLNASVGNNTVNLTIFSRSHDGTNAARTFAITPDVIDPTVPTSPTENPTIQPTEVPSTVATTDITTEPIVTTQTEASPSAGVTSTFEGSDVTTEPTVTTAQTEATSIRPTEVVSTDVTTEPTVTTAQTEATSIRPTEVVSTDTGTTSITTIISTDTIATAEAEATRLVPIFSTDTTETEETETTSMDPISSTIEVATILPTTEVSLASVESTDKTTSFLILTTALMETLSIITTGESTASTKTETQSLPPTSVTTSLTTESNQPSTTEETATTTVVHTPPTSIIVPPNVPEIEAYSVTSFSIGLQWNFTVGALGYILRVEIANSQFRQKRQVDNDPMVFNLTQTNFTVMDLSPAVIYLISLSAYNEGGESEAATLEVETSPLPPTNLTITRENGGSTAIFQWIESIGAVSYQITLQDSRSMQIRRAETADTTLMQNNLDRFSSYNISIIACNSMGHCSEPLSGNIFPGCRYNPCSDIAVCSEVNSQVNCTCRIGFSGDGLICEDIDECRDDTDNCNQIARCINTIGSFDCACPLGYIGNGLECEIMIEDIWPWMAPAIFLLILLTIIIIALIIRERRKRKSYRVA